MKKKTIIISIICTLIFVLIGTPLAITLSDIVQSHIIVDDYNNIKEKDEFQTSYLIDGITLVRQKVSCGYAVMEMFGDFANKNITEHELYKSNNDNIVTSSTTGFEKEMNKVFTSYETTAYTWLKSSDLISKCYQSLKNGIPVPFEMAYKLNDSWTLHFSLLIGINLVKDEFRILNPYGYDEIMNSKEFIAHTSYEAWENMPIYLSWAFGLRIFDKNTIFIVNKKTI